MTERVFQLIGTCNNYPWGKKGKESLAAQLCKKTDKEFEIKDDEYYSELWFGDYPDFPAKVLETREPLADVLQRNKETLLGKKVINHLDSQLPYLPKILSIAKALPLQIHPDKYLSEKLHAKDPENFTDPNHKPEIAIALTPFEVFGGFKPVSEIQTIFKQVPALHSFVPQDAPDGTWTDKTLREVTRNLLKADPDTVKSVESTLASTPKDTLGKQAYILELLPRLQDQYGSTDPGSLVALLCMNFMTLLPGEALYIPSDGIHAYLSGDIVECMARSNNVLNSGFCPPEDRNDVALFTDSLTFEAHKPEDLVLKHPKTEKGTLGKTEIYNPPIREFQVLKTKLVGGEREIISPSEGPAVLIVTKGVGTMAADGKTFRLEEGGIFFVAPGVEASYDAVDDLEVFTVVV
ncbi:RmlC-like cupin domain-containing protein [Cladorrhinum sp. PSN259]|nr:RmlC-like cupin domain-containing protein [Cladorrhinum sp. PSN259]